MKFEFFIIHKKVKLMKRKTGYCMLAKKFIFKFSIKSIVLIDNKLKFIRKWDNILNATHLKLWILIEYIKVNEQLQLFY